MLIDLPQDVLKAMLIFVSPQDIIRLRKVCRYLYNFIKFCRQQLPMPGAKTLKILAPSTGYPDQWKFIVEYTHTESDEQGSLDWKIYGINSLNLPVEKNF